MTRNLLVALLTLTTSTALAQTAEPQPATGTPPPAEAAPATQPAAAETAPTQPSEAPTAPSLDERLTTTEGKVTSVEEQYAETKNDVSLLKKLKLSGYVQARYLYQEPDEDEGNAETRLNDGYSRFTLRRVRFKATYTGDVGQVMIQMDALPTGFVLRDAEATLYIPGTRQKLALTLGQTKWPFSYEAIQSSSDREFPERTRVVQSFLPSERDRGLKLAGKFGVLNFSAGVFDGNGIANTNFIGTDNDKEKDLIGRVGFDLKWVSGGINGWYGHTLGRRTTVPNPDAFRVAYDRTRVGADVQFYLDLLPVGGTAIKGEYITGTTYHRNNVEQFGVPASGWWALVVQNLGLSNQVAVRYDYFDAENGRGPTESGTRLGTNNAVGTLGFAAIHHFGETVKLTAVYEMPMTATVDSGTAQDPTDNLFTLQLQARY